MRFDPLQRLLFPLARLTHGVRREAEGLCPCLQLRRLDDQRVGEAVQPPHDESVARKFERFFRSFVRTYRTAFPTVAVHPVIEEGDGGGLTELRNLMLVATEGALPSEEFLLERWRELAPASAPDLEKPIRDRYDKQIRLDDVPTLTDDYAPTDSLLLVD